MYIMAGAQAVKFFTTPREMCEDVDSLLTSSPSSALVRHLRRWFSPLLHWRRARIGPSGCTATAATATFACESAFSFAFFPSSFPWHAAAPPPGPPPPSLTPSPNSSKKENPASSTHPCDGPFAACQWQYPPRFVNSMSTPSTLQVNCGWTLSW